MKDEKARQARYRWKAFLESEISYLETRIKPHDTGHIKTTINTLRTRVREIERLQANDPNWYDEYLIGSIYK
jgi:hypothetical protein